MLSLCVIGCGKENIRNFIAFLQAELRTFIKQNNACFYNLKTLWKAEASPELLKKNSHFILPSNKDTNCEYWGFLDVSDWESLYSKLFSPMEIDESSYFQHNYYTFSRLKMLFQRFVKSPLGCSSKRTTYDFRIIYHSEMIDDSDRVCIIEIDIASASLDVFEYFYGIVCKLDTLFPDVFLSAYIDDSYILNFDLKFDSEMLKKRIIDTGKAFYISNNFAIADSITDASILRQWNVTPMKNGVCFMLYNACKCFDFDTTLINDILMPHYMVVSWSNLSMQEYLRIKDFDTISVYYDKYSPTDPTLILSRGYSFEQLDCLAMEYGDSAFQERYATNYLFDNLKNDDSALRTSI